MDGVALRQPLGDLYQELGVARDATREEIAAAYRARAKELHPDTRPIDADAAERFARVGVAYRVLSDPIERARYDDSLVAPPTPTPPSPLPPSPAAAPGPRPAPRKPHRLRRTGARWCAWGGGTLIVLGLVVGAFVFSLERHDADLRAHGVAVTAVVHARRSRRTPNPSSTVPPITNFTATIHSVTLRPVWLSSVTIELGSWGS
jgi:hypothetical protein